MKLKDLKPNIKNPRKMSQADKERLRESVEKYGDLSGFIYNRRTKNLIGGHQRQGVLPPDATIKIEKKFEAPTKSNTVAIGNVIIGEEMFRYREVDADELWEAEAMIAANKHSGEWDGDTLKILFADFPDLNFEAAGFKLDELKAFNISPIKFDIAPKVKVEEEPELTDEQYVTQTEETTEQIPTANPNENVVFSEVEEKTEVDNKRYVIIIDCKDQMAKDELRKQLQPIIDQAGAKIF